MSKNEYKKLEREFNTLFDKKWGIGLNRDEYKRFCELQNILSAEDRARDFEELITSGDYRS